MGVVRHGCVRFDADDPNMGGWASVEGMEAFRISSVGNLDNDTLWWTNLSFSAIYGANLHKTPYIKRTTYLNSWLQEGQADICSAWGLMRRSYTEKQITEILSGVFSRVMWYAKGAYGIDGSRSVPMHDNLADEIRCKILPDKDPHIAPEVDGALSAAHQYYTYCLTPHYNREEMVVVRFSAPAVAYAREMLSMIVPGEQVEYFSAEQIAPISDKVQWVVNNPRPVLAKVSVSNINPDYVNVIAFANGAKAGSNRSWVSQPELLLLSQYAQVEVACAFVFSGYEMLETSCELPMFSALQAMSPGAELLAMNHWVGLSRENCYRLEPKSTEYRAVSPRAAWITAVDRFLMFTYALQLHKAGFAIRKYGAGSVTCLVPKHNFKDAYDIASSIGLLAPPNMSSDIEVQEDLHNV
ncbi:TPA: hypothetical protein L4623_005372 [Pseudomonas aeruginosa]|jgi:hypothetical protein|uniref:Uncharacterized protein n=4 Tax=root TaxID=1 RepID=A0A6H1Q9L2_PSEAI|nr:MULTISPECIES: hypothetical protein [Gammaproteobacteria]MDP9031004.1 hypothetical protein [Pseudomonadota bacterium]QPN48163.1 hypothetical protein I5S86_28615 [Priestia aryabhattai]EGB97767.1 hypothetical protein G1E_16723 [Pseudomonas sp. TJI-51]EKB4876804.1 hypothetical protein [Pseudomonas aeruginosa]EKE7663773.1 hypothetical protein [Pseudomonas aeruginosa]